MIAYFIRLGLIGFIRARGGRVFPKTGLLTHEQDLYGEKASVPILGHLQLRKESDCDREWLDHKCSSASPLHADGMSLD